MCVFLYSLSKQAFQAAISHNYLHRYEELLQIRTASTHLHDLDLTMIGPSPPLAGNTISLCLLVQKPKISPPSYHRHLGQSCFGGFFILFLKTHPQGRFVTGKNTDAHFNLSSDSTNLSGNADPFVAYYAQKARAVVAKDN